MASLAKQAKRAVKRVTMAWRYALIQHTPAWARRVFGPVAIYLDMLFIDHGFVRMIYLNKHKVSDKAWRSAQPAPHHLRRMARDGIRTIVNLRGVRDCGSFWLEEKVCKELGINFVSYQVRSRAAPTREELRGARALFERIEYPMLMHCKSGADRVGMMSALYKHQMEGVAIADAMDQLSLRFGHIKQADTGVLDAFFERYLKDCEDRPMAFYDWVETVYDADDVKQSFVANGWSNRLVNTILRRE